MEELLNKLIEKGWKPRGEKVNKVIKTGIDEFGDGYVLFDGELNGYKQRGCNMTELVSKGSGLWQFVCENGMRPKRPGYEEHIWQRDRKTNGDRCILENEYQYYLIESALCDEDKLEDFILDNVKIGDI